MAAKLCAGTVRDERTPARSYKLGVCSNTCVNVKLSVMNEAKGHGHFSIHLTAGGRNIVPAGEGAQRTCQSAQQPGHT